MAIYMVKVTYTLDEATIAALNEKAMQKQISRSQALREAIADYAARDVLLSDEERIHKLNILDRIAAQPPTRPQAEVELELSEIRRARRHGGRMHRVDSVKA
jgi:hypothetical protein